MGDPQEKEEAEAAEGEWGALGPPCGEVNILYCIDASLPSPPVFEPGTLATSAGRNPVWNMQINK